jgi:hypothetical protein
VITLGLRESTWTPFCSVIQTLRFRASRPRASAKCPPVCSSWNCPTRNVGTRMRDIHVSGERSSKSAGVR